MRGPKHFREQEARRSITMIEKKMEEQLDAKLPDAFDKLASGLFKDQKIDIEIKL